MVCVREHSGAKGLARLVLYELAGHAHDDGAGIWASQTTLAREAGLGRRTVQYALNGDPRRERRPPASRDPPRRQARRSL